MKNTIILLSLINLSIFLFGCHSNNKNSTDNTVSTSVYSFEYNQKKITKDYLIGKWTSTEENRPIDLSISKNLETNILELDISFTKNNVTKANFYSYDKNSKTWVFLHESKPIEYTFNFYEENLLMYRKYISEKISEPNEATIGMKAPISWSLKKLVKINFLFC